MNANADSLRRAVNDLKREQERIFGGHVLFCRNCGETNYACDCDSGPNLTDRKPRVIFCLDVDE